MNYCLRTFAGCGVIFIFIHGRRMRSNVLRLDHKPVDYNTLSIMIEHAFPLRSPDVRYFFICLSN